MSSSESKAVFQDCHDPMVRDASLVDATQTALPVGVVMRSQSTRPDDSRTGAISIDIVPPEQGVTPGARIGRYLVLEHLGSGGMGAVYKVYDPELDRMVALKVLRGDRTSSSTQRARLVREAQALARLAHPNVVPVHDVGITEDAVFITMELVQGRTLEQWLAETERSVPEILAVLMAAGQGLEAAHRAGLVHRDFKPRNVLVGDDGRVRILDFGLARSVADSSLDSACRPFGSPSLGSFGSSLSSNSSGNPSGNPSGTPPSSDDSVPSTADSLSDSGRRPVPVDSLTRTGLILGTPRYMAPEQYLDAAVDAQADQFSFCVALYQALYGRYPFAGKTLPELKRNVLGGKARQPPRRRGVSTRIERAIMRGLATEPGARFPSMGALVAELGRRSLWARFRLVALTMLVTLCVVAVVFGARRLWLARAIAEERARIEVVAAERLGAVERRIASLVERGATAEADEAFMAFARLDEHRGTRALVHAWLSRAERERRAQRWDAELGAYANAFAASTQPELKIEALVGLARVFHERWDTGSLAVVLDTLGSSLGPAEPPELGSLRVGLALARHDLAAAAELGRTRRGVLDPELLPVLDALAPATRTQYRALSVMAADMDGNGRPELLLHDASMHIVRALQAEPGLTPLWTHALPEADGLLKGLWTLPVDPGQPPHLLANFTKQGQPGEAVLYQITDRGLVARHRWEENIVLSAVAADLDGNGQREAYVGSGPYTRSIYRLERAAGSAWIRTIPSPEVTQASSDVNDLMVADLDQDGQNELIAAQGPWHAYDLRVMRGNPDGSLSLVDRERLGAVARVQVFEAERELRLAVVKYDAFANLRVFPRDQSYGKPAGLYIYALRAGKLVELDHVPMLMPRGYRADELGDYHLYTADIDGDTRTDLVLSFLVFGLGWQTVLYRQTDSGALVPLVIPGLTTLAALELDGDRADELVVRVADDDEQIWILGVGTERLPQVELARTIDEPRPIPPVVTGELRRQWARAEELVAMGMIQQAAGVLDELATLSEGQPTAYHARYRGGHLWRATKACQRAAERFEQAVSVGTALPPDMIIDALRAAADCHVEGARYSEALRVLRQLLHQPGLASTMRQRAWDDVAWITPIVEEREMVRIGFAEPLASTWRIEEPLALRRDGQGGTLRVDTFADQDILASLPLEKTQERLALTVELELERLEWAAGIVVLLRPHHGGDDQRLGVFASVGGGGLMYQRHVRCIEPGPEMRVSPVLVDDRPHPAHRETMTLTVEYLPQVGQIVCSARLADGREVHDRRQLKRLLPAGGYDLVLAGSHREVQVDAPLLASARIRRISVAGARLAASQEAEETGLSRGNRLLVEGHAEAALAAYDTFMASTPDAALRRAVHRAVALAALGRMREAARELARGATAGRKAAERGATEDQQAALRRVFAHLVRHPNRGLAMLVQTALGQSYFGYYADAWLSASVQHPSDSLVTDVLTSELGGLHEWVLAPGKGREDEAYQQLMLLSMRGSAWMERGLYAAARADLRAAAALAEKLVATEQPKVAAEREISARELWETAYRLLATVEASVGDIELARAYALQCLEVAATREIARDRLLSSPQLRALAARPEWRAIAGE